MSLKPEHKNSDVDFNEICRICFRKSFDFISIFPQFVDNSRHIAYMIMACASVQVHENDGLPQQICRKCALILNIAFDFKLECEDTDAKLRQYLSTDTPPSHKDIIDFKEESLKPAIQFQVEQICVNANSNGGINLKIIPINDSDSSQVNEISTNPQSDININNTDVKPRIENLNKRKKAVARRKSSKTSHRVLEVNEEDGSIRRVHQCDICGKTFNRKEYLTQHTRIHTGEKPYHCHLCEKRFINSGHLTTHMRTHTGVKPHHCHICPKAFSTRQELTKHTMVHNGERPFQCNICNKKFGSSSNMYTHLKHHTGEKNFTCEQCGKPFYTKQELKQHLVIHTGEKAFVCNICKKGFAQIAHLRRHSKLHK